MSIVESIYLIHKVNYRHEILPGHRVLVIIQICRKGVFFHSRWLPMLSYQHAYHAGSFADVLKHVTLCLICDYMGQKEKPLFYLETHAGRGNYDLTSPMAQKTAEYKAGVELFWKK